MKDKLFQSLKQKYSNLGLSDETLQSVAESLATTGLVTDENLETVVSGQGAMLKSYQSSFDKMRTESANYKKELEELKGKGGAPEDEPDDKEIPAWFRTYQKQQEEKINALTTANEAAKAEKAKAERAGMILSKAKALKISQGRIDEGFAISDDMDEAGIDTYLAKVKSNEVAKGLETENSAFSLSTSADESKKMADEWADALPDAK